MRSAYLSMAKGDNMKIAVVGAATIAVFSLLTGCASPAEMRYQASNTSSYKLCLNLAQATLASNEQREIWAMELQARRENCSQYASAVSAATATNAAAMQTGLQLLQQSRGAAAPATNNAPVGLLKRHYQSGFNRICIYDRLGSDAALTIPAAQICPATY